MSNYQDSDVTISGTKSAVKYTPKNEMDFGTLVCWASNSVGAGAPPCVYHLLPIGPPEPPLACSASNVTYSTVKVSRLRWLILNNSETEFMIRARCGTRSFISKRTMANETESSFTW